MFLPFMLLLAGFSRIEQEKMLNYQTAFYRKSLLHLRGTGDGQRRIVYAGHGDPPAALSQPFEMKFGKSRD